MRIALLHSYDLNGSGSSIYAWNLAKTLARQGHEVVVFRFRADEESERERELFELGVRLEELPVWAATVTYARPEFRNAKHILDLDDASVEARVHVVQERLQEVHKSEPIDLVIANHFLVGATAMVSWAKHQHVKSVAISHGTDIEYVAAQHPRWAERGRQVVLAADHNVVLNERARERVSDVLGVSCERLNVIPPGIDLNVFQYLPTTRRDSVALVGRLILDKGPHLLLASLPFLLEVNPSLDLVLIGDGTAKEVLQKLVNILSVGDAQGLVRLAQGDEDHRARFAPVLNDLLSVQGRDVWARHQGLIRDRVRFAGSLPPERVAEELSRCKVAVLPSMIQECYPLSLIEALACGCRVAGTSLAVPPSLWELVDSCESEASRGALFEPGPRDLARVALQQLRAWRPEVAGRLSTKIRECMSWSKVGSSVLHHREADNDSWDANERLESSWPQKGPIRLLAEG